jgi:hypothetical protein
VARVPETKAYKLTSSQTPILAETPLYMRDETGACISIDLVMPNPTDGALVGLEEVAAPPDYKGSLKIKRS